MGNILYLNLRKEVDKLAGTGDWPALHIPWVTTPKVAKQLEKQIMTFLEKEESSIVFISGRKLVDKSFQNPWYEFSVLFSWIDLPPNRVFYQHFSTDRGGSYRKQIQSKGLQPVRKFQEMRRVNG